MRAVGSVLTGIEYGSRAFVEKSVLFAQARASNETALAASIHNLRLEESGWIMLKEAKELFSEMDDQYAFGEMDDQGKRNLESFAALHTIILSTRHQRQNCRRAAKRREVPSSAHA